MGCGSSKLYFEESVDELPIRGLDDAIHEHIEYCRGILESRHACIELPMLISYQEFLLKHKQLTAACIEIIAHSQKLINKSDGFRSFCVAIYVNIVLDKLLCLNDASLYFFEGLQQRDQTSFARLLTALQARCNGLFLQAHHVDAVVRILNKKNALPSNMLHVLNDYLETVQPDTHLIVQQLRKEYSPYIVQQASHANLVHHNLKHAAEIKVRTMHAADVLGLFGSISSKQHDFLRVIMGFAVEFHDHEQKIVGKYSSVEQATSARITNWLLSEGGLPSPSQEISHFIAFLNDYIVVLGTTMIFGVASTMDLTELFFIFQSALQQSLLFVERSNASFFEMVECFALISGVCDKNSASVFEVVHMHVDDIEANTMLLLMRYFQCKKTVIQEFFEQQAFPFSLYFDGVSREYSYQAFFITLVPHICMRAEFSAVTDFRKFVKECQILYDVEGEDDVFMQLVDNKFREYHVAELVKHFFLSKEMINKEMNFCKSQVQSLQFAQQRLQDLCTNGQIISPSVPLIDAKNLDALYQYFTGLSNGKKIVLIKELTLSVVLQAGTFYLKKPMQRPIDANNIVRLESLSINAGVQPSRQDRHNTHAFKSLQSHGFYQASNSPLHNPMGLVDDNSAIRPK